MKVKPVVLLVVLIVAFNTFKYETKAENQNIITMKQDLLCLMLGYSDFVKGVEKDSNDNVYLLMKSGRKILYDDKKTKGPEEKLNNPDLQDSMEQLYPLQHVSKLMDKNFDPGRARVYELLKEVYGSSKGEIEKNITTVNTSAGRFQFNKNNNAALELKAALNELTPMARSNPKISAGLFPTSGTFNYRFIAGTNRLSPHSFGTAIDLSRDKRDYWQWATREQGEKRLLSYPVEIVEIFEKHNFVWGGKWGHFDILHFEYRPEIITKSRYFGKQGENSPINWYEGAPTEDKAVMNMINVIDEAIK